MPKTPGFTPTGMPHGTVRRALPSLAGTGTARRPPGSIPRYGRMDPPVRPDGSPARPDPSVSPGGSIHASHRIRPPLHKERSPRPRDRTVRRPGSIPVSGRTRPPSGQVGSISSIGPIRLPAPPIPRRGGPVRRPHRVNPRPPSNQFSFGGAPALRIASPRRPRRPAIRTANNDRE